MFLPSGSFIIPLLLHTFIVLLQLTFAMFTFVVFCIINNVYESNRNYKGNEKLGNKEEARKFERLTACQLCINPTIALQLVGGIDILGNVFISLTQV